MSLFNWTLVPGRHAFDFGVPDGVVNSDDLEQVGLSYDFSDNGLAELKRFDCLFGFQLETVYLP